MSEARVEIDARSAFQLLKVLDVENVMDKKSMRKLLRQAASPIAKGVRNAFRSSVGSDPRKAYQAVKVAVYRQANGVNVSLLNGRGGGSSVASVVRGGGASGITRNRRKSERTEAQQGYWGKNRAFVLRFLNQGTKSRTAIMRASTGSTANRGAIAAKDFFNRGVAAGKQQAQDILTNGIEDKIKEVSSKV